MQNLKNNPYTTICGLAILLVVVFGIGLGYLTETQVATIVSLAASIGLLKAKDNE